MKFSIFLFLLFEVIASQAWAAKLPTYSPNNPYGKWAELPRGNNYMFCGDRVLFASNFNEKIKIMYGNDERQMTIKQHCEFRRRELERQAKERASEEPSLVELQYEKISSYFKKVPGGIKPSRVYSLREIAKAMKLHDVNGLRAANLMLPALTEAEFAKLYVGDTNNPQFVKTEHERYVSNLLTQNPAMLYTADGNLYYFSLNLSNDQLKLLGAVVSSGGGGGAGSSGGGNFAGGKGGGRGSNGDPSKKQVANALEGAKTNPFSGFLTNRLSLQVRPQATTLPSSFGIESSATFVPYDLKIPSISRGQSRGVASSGSSTRSSKSSRVGAVKVSSNPSLGMMNVGGAARPSTSGGNTRSGYTSVSSSSNGTTSSSTVASKPTSSAPLAVNGSPSKSLAVAETGVTVASSGPPPISLVTRIGQADDINYNCQRKAWALNLHTINEYGFEKVPEELKSNACLPKTLSEYCGEGEAGSKYKTQCLDKESNATSCYAQAETDVKSICKEYIDYPLSKTGYELNSNDIKICAETMMALACQKIPCDLEADSAGKGVYPILYKTYNKLLSAPSSPLFAKGNSDNSDDPFDTIDTDTYNLIPIEKILEIPYVAKYNSDSSIHYTFSLEKISYSNLNKKKWPTKAEGSFKDDLTLLTSFYELHFKSNIICPKKSGKDTPAAKASSD
ncbi:MAG: hypothetical protein KDD37_05455 [Bdellovibrionales bacterium]|nr:hypothetical protein [Bdellovibrionales bacterium]